VPRLQVHVLAVAVALLLGACATPQTDALAVNGARGLGVRPAHEIAAVPFFAQERAQCGPATLAMALDASGLALTPDALRDTVFVPGRAGSFAPEMLAAARRQGRLAVPLEPTLVAVLREVDADHPVIVLQNLGLSFFPVWHYALVIGYDVPAGEMLLHSGPDPRARMSLALFERTWSRAGNWAMVVVDPARLPVSVGDDALLDAAAALERVDAAAARRTYEALRARTPGLFGAWMGLGNAAAAQGDSTAAAAAFEQASTLDPSQADAWNNLASVLASQGDLARARTAIAQALRLGGAHRAVYEQTRDEIEQAGHAASGPSGH
jgi:tetratricopeptide (TPR) repeat protein